MKMDEFLLEVYKWLMEPRNQCVAEYHEYLLLANGKKKTTQVVEAFMSQRWLSTHPDEKRDEQFFHKCAVEYVKELCA